MNVHVARALFAFVSATPDVNEINARIETLCANPISVGTAIGILGSRNIIFEEPAMHSLVRKALVFATRAHSGQKCKNTVQSPYIVHPIELVLIGVQAGVTNADVLAGVLLHDVIESIPE